MVLCWTWDPRKAADPEGQSAAPRLSVPTPDPGRKGWGDSRGKRNLSVPLRLPLTPNELTTEKLKAQRGLHVRVSHLSLIRLDCTWLLFSQEGLPGLAPAGIYPRLRVSSPGTVCGEEAAGSGKENSKVNSNTSQGSSVPYNRETFSLCPPGGHGVAMSAWP